MKQSTRVWIKVGVLSVAAIIVLIIIFQNRTQVDTRLLWATISMPLVLLLLITLVVGFLLGVLAVGLLRTRGKGRSQL